VEVRVIRRQVLFYDFVAEDLLERRAPHRPEHIALVREWMADGRVLMAGALGDPPHGGALVFATDDPAEPERFAGVDPYVREGLVTGWRVEPWDVVD
jgi:uncharacterized protein